ncbi:MAG: J domain-containing protein [Leptospiraceae bacterium]|nr:J domain-containing protein [Leptospiraceae bacterium]
MKARTELNGLIEEIQSRVCGVDWRLEFRELAVWCDWSQEALLQLAWRLYHRSNLGQTVDGFGPHNVLDLIELLEQGPFHGLAVKAEFIAGGLFLEPGDLEYWLDFLYSVSLSYLQNQELDAELLEDIIRSSPDSNNALLFYCHSQFDTEQLLHRACALYCKHLQIRPTEVITHLLQQHCRQAERRRDWDWDDVFLGMEDSFRNAATRIGLEWLDTKSRADQATLSAPGVQQAFAVLGMPITTERASLQQRFRSLLMQYHPDRNPDGQEQCQKIIAAWKTLRDHGVV